MYFNCQSQKMGRNTFWIRVVFVKFLMKQIRSRNCKNNRVITFPAFLISVITVHFLKCLKTKYLIFLQVSRVIFVNGGSMTNAKVYQDFYDDKNLEGK